MYILKDIPDNPGSGMYPASDGGSLVTWVHSDWGAKAPSPIRMMQGNLLDRF